MSGPAYKAYTTHCLPRSRSVEKLGSVATLTRVSSVPNLSTFHVGSDRYKSSTLHKYRKNCDTLDDHNIDRYTFYQPFYWPTYRFAARRALYVDPIPNSLGFEYPDYWSRYKWYTDWLNPTYWRRYRDPNYDRPLWNNWRPWQMDRSRYKWYTDWLNPTYWRRYRDPNYDRPLWNNWRPWQMDRSNVKRAVEMFRNGLIDFKTLDDKWITPSAFGRYGKDWSDVYLPAARYGAHRYFYSFS
ncbi:hypothetical protein DICVIV_11659 [Dictyocaulus viviparus]|uniref:Uncharacterized protein n=1 Tax=Dictyocaulus viviparus TaxID=29172 RepID=A0A0D8XCM1_DICVI|nr:hypothetical protein DICVIV_11659 [Dictyocaulus viviparus]